MTSSTVGLPRRACVCNVAMLQSATAILAAFATAAPLIAQCEPPGISSQPQPASTCRSAAFSVVATGTSPFTYWWEIEDPPGVWNTRGNDPGPLPGGGAAYATPLSSPDVHIGVLGRMGTFGVRCVVTNACGSVTSDAVTISVCDNAGDVDCDGVTNESDLGILLANWSQVVPTNMQGDLDGDGFVGESDLGILLADWSAACP